MYRDTDFYIYKWMCTFKTCLVLFSFSCHIALLCFVLFSAPWPMRRRRAEEQEHRFRKERRKNYFYFLLPQRPKSTSYWCNKWYIGTGSPRHCLWSVFLISKSRANFYGPHSSKTMHQSLTVTENSTVATQSQRSFRFSFLGRILYQYINCTLPTYTVDIRSTNAKIELSLIFFLVGCGAVQTTSRLLKTSGICVNF